MATTTPNYGWDVPTSSDYVKDGAVAIETLGDDIDASLYSITSGKDVGLSHIDTLSFTSVSSVSFADDVFTSDYDNYRLVLYLDGANSGSQNIALRLRSAGTDNTSSNYQYQRHGIVNSINFVDVPATTTSFNTVIASNPLSTASLQFDIIAPKLTRKTVVQGLSLQNQSALLFNIHYAGQMTVTTSYDALTLFASASTITGVARLYGYRN
jgi:hypothetical protein